MHGFASKYRVIFVALISVSNFFICKSFAAEQGTLGSRSTASIEISVQINQTFTTIHPGELVLTSVNSVSSKSSQPFCVVNHGYGENASIPYELIVETISVQTDKETPIYNVYLSESDAMNQKVLLTQGLIINSQSEFTSSNIVNKHCSGLGSSISVEQTNGKLSNSNFSPTPGSLLLVISPN